MWLRGYEVLPPAGTDSRTRALTQKASPEFRALHRSGRLFDDFLQDHANISVVAGNVFPPWIPNAKRSCKPLWVVKRHDHVLMDF